MKVRDYYPDTVECTHCNLLLLENPYWDIKAREVRVKQVCAERALTNMDSYARPSEGGFMVRAVWFRGQRICLKFDQAPPDGSIPVANWDNPDYTHFEPGELFFLDPKGEMWVVPNIWYNQHHKGRHLVMQMQVDYLRKKLDNLRKEIADIEQTTVTGSTPRTARELLCDRRRDILAELNVACHRSLFKLYNLEAYCEAKIQNGEYHIQEYLRYARPEFR